MQNALGSATLRPTPSPRASLLSSNPPRYTESHARSSLLLGTSLNNGVLDTPLCWKSTGPMKAAQDLGVKRWDGVARRSSDWDCLRKDPELWNASGNCLVHLYGQGQSRRGPAFKVPIDAILTKKCHPLLKRFLAEPVLEPSISEADGENSNYPHQKNQTKIYELYIPSPSIAKREQAFSYHIATRNLFAWICGKPLVGNHLGGALVGLLNSINEFRTKGEDHVETIMEYIDEQGYQDMINQPDHALAILFFAEEFQFKDLWISAFVHCCGMNEKLAFCDGFECMSRTSKALTTRSRFEMEMRLDYCGQRLGSFLSDDFSETSTGLPSVARAHLDKFRSFLRSYYVAKLGYYPPILCDQTNNSFPKNIYTLMCSEFRNLYNFLVDSDFTMSDSTSSTNDGGICVLQFVQTFDQRHKYKSLQHQMPLLPECDEAAFSRLGISRRFSFTGKDKMKPDPRLVTFASLSRATNGKDQAFIDCTLVRAYREFEKDCVFSPSKADKNNKLSPMDARKVRWILVYSILQTLLSATRVPEQVCNTQNVPYNLSVLVAGCPPWKERPLETLFRTQSEQMMDDYAARRTSFSLQGSAPLTSNENKVDGTCFPLNHKTRDGQNAGDATGSSMALPKRNSMRKTLSTLGSMSELRHPKSQRASYQEIRVHGYGNGANPSITTECIPSMSLLAPRKSSESSCSSVGEMSSRWSNTSNEANDITSPTTSISSDSRRGSETSASSLESSDEDFLDTSIKLHKLSRVSSSIYSNSEYDLVTLKYQPVELKNNHEEVILKKPETNVRVHWEDCNGLANQELLAYLNA